MGDTRGLRFIGVVFTTAAVVVARVHAEGLGVQLMAGRTVVADCRFGTVGDRVQRFEGHCKG
jgi:hypothetical protein